MRTLALFALLALTASCPQQPRSANATSRAPLVAPGPAITVTPGALPAGWPSVVPLYPQAAVVEGRATESSGAPLLTAILATPDTPEQVHAFYGQKVSTHQFTVVSSSETKGEKVSLYRRAGQSLSVSTTRDDAAKETRIELTLAGRYEARAGEPPVRRPTPPPAQKSGEEKKADEPKGDEQTPEQTHPLLPLYPGTKGETKLDGRRVTLRLSTTDPLEQVCAWYEQFYHSQGLTPGGRSEFGSQVSEVFTGPQGTAQLNVRSSGSSTSINLSYEGAAPIF